MGTFLVLENRIPDHNPTRWLGRFTSDMRRPSDNFSPDFTGVHTGNLFPENFSPITIAQTDIKLLLGGSKDTQLTAKLQEVVSFKSASSNERFVEVTAAAMTTYRLPQHHRVFEKMCKDPVLGCMEEIKQMLAHSSSTLSTKPREIYMIVGVATVDHAKYSTSINAVQGHRASVTVPVGQVMEQSTGRSAGNILNLNPSTSIGGETKGSITTQGAGAVEKSEIFAVEYRVVKRKLAKFKNVPVLRDIRRFDHGEGAFGSPLQDYNTPKSSHSESGSELDVDLELVADPPTVADVEAAVTDDNDECWTSGNIAGIQTVNTFLYSVE